MYQKEYKTSKIKYNEKLINQMFQNQKKIALKKAFENDKSKKGEIDKEILSTINLINSHPNFYTTSSCAGRIMLVKEGIKKNETNWLFVSHDYVKLSDIKRIIKNFENNLPKESVWFRMEAPILHICAENLDLADKLLKIANNSGFRRSAILSFKKRVIIEIFIPDKINTIFSRNKKILVSDDYLKVLIKEANNKLKKARLKVKKFEYLFKNLSLS
ncbi:MAG: tRNA wybutosine-synthesizing 3 family protein [Candidatus Woesearchaeota archaeon]